MTYSFAVLFQQAAAADKHCQRIPEAGFGVVMPRTVTQEKIDRSDPQVLTLEAVKIDSQEQQIQATGQVELHYGKQVFLTDQLNYQRDQDLIDTPGAFGIYTNKSRISGRNLRYNLKTPIASANDVRFEYQDHHGSFQGAAAHLEKSDEKHYRLEDVRLNTCQSGDAPWYIAAKEVYLDDERQIGEAYGAHFVFYGLPLLYLPWLDFPLYQGRKSGLLTPTFSGGSNGFQLSLPYYLNLAPHYDATLTTRIYGNRGLALAAQGRYLLPSGRGAGEVNGQWLVHDRIKQQQRYAFQWQHQQHLTPRWQLDVDFHQVSDDDYYRDLGSREDAAEYRYLKQYLQLSYRKRGDDRQFVTKIRLKNYQTLFDEASAPDQPYRVLPQIDTAWYRRFNYGFKTDLSTQLSYFTHDDKPNAWRWVMYPQISWLKRQPWGFIRPKIGLHMTAYALDQNNAGMKTMTRVLPIISMDSGLTFEKERLYSGEAWIQTLEPRLFYTYIPTRHQEHLPNFDSVQSDFNEDTLFRENRFTGQDRMSAAHQLSVGLMSRFYKNKTGEEHLRIGIGQRFYLHEDAVNIDGSIGRRGKHRSDFLLFLSGRIAPAWYVKSHWHYNDSNKHTKRFSGSLMWQPEENKKIALKYGYDRRRATLLQQDDLLKYIDAALYWPVTQNYQLLARQSYSLTDNKPLDQLVGIRYHDHCDCWRAALTYQRYRTDYDQYRHAIFLHFELKGLGRVGKRFDQSIHSPFFESND